MKAVQVTVKKDGVKCSTIYYGFNDKEDAKKHFLNQYPEYEEGEIEVSIPPGFEGTEDDA